MQYLTKDELDRLLDTAKNHSNNHFLMLLCAFNHGLRASEVVSMKGSQVSDFYLTIPRLKGSIRTVQPLLASEYGLVELAKAVGDARMFPMHRVTFWRIMQKYCKIAGVPAHKAHPHALKHTCAVLGLNGGMKINEVQTYLGHKSGASTLEYLKVNSEQASKAFANAVGI